MGGASLMDWQYLFNAAFGVICIIGGWWLNTMWQAMRDLETKVASIDVLVAGQYVKKEELNKLADAIFHKLDRIQDAIERKADK
jgi:cell division protein FtsB